ncbi:TIGR03086 family protein [Actinorhabdospora filicis]|uniref:TIGR03086 family protein n=1 Tax=Actinorhabdospora filicis TaxID=1785913 RepID=A0A9W6SS24_9ACTN|nr:TIGR03086 family metal-binding protein [Actinorhabdospora filicis]GLZ81222.1 TIGR03086 family protein [Actinorhabdospora filicis]
MSEEVKDVPVEELLTEATTAALPVIDGIADTDLDAPTPCAEFTVRDLANHLHQVVVNFQALARRETPDWSTTPDALADPGWKRGFAGEAAKLAEAWSAPGALDGVSPGFGMPQPVVARMVLLDLTLHAWDLARGTGREFVPAPRAVDALRGFVDDMAPTARQMGVFGEEVQVPEDAGAFECVLARSGRDPRWERPSKE